MSEVKQQTVKLGSPQLFVVSLGYENSLDTQFIEANTWQEAVHAAATKLFETHGLEEPTGIMPVVEYLQAYATISSMKLVLWEKSLTSLSVGIARPAVYAIDTGYVPSTNGTEGPISSTTVKVAVEYLPLYNDVVYLP